MKRFKKVLALVLAGVMALAMLSACGITDPDQLIPTDGSFEIYQAVNNEAVDKGKAEVKYSVKYSAVTKELLNNWLLNKNNPTAYAEGYNAIVKELGNVKVVVGLVDANTIPASATATAYLTYKSAAFNASSIVGVESYTSATHIGIAFVTTDTGLTYRLVCLFNVPKQ